jgi:hypothetical protein
MNCGVNTGRNRSFLRHASASIRNDRRPISLPAHEVARPKQGACNVQNAPPYRQSSAATRDPDLIPGSRRMKESPTARTSTPRVVTATSSRTRQTKATSRTDECHTRTQTVNASVVRAPRGRIASTPKREVASMSALRPERLPTTANHTSREAVVSAINITRTTIVRGAEQWLRQLRA